MVSTVKTLRTEHLCLNAKATTIYRCVFRDKSRVRSGKFLVLNFFRWKIIIYREIAAQFWTASRASGKILSRTDDLSLGLGCLSRLWGKYQLGSPFTMLRQAVAPLRNNTSYLLQKPQICRNMVEKTNPIWRICHGL